MENAYKLSDHTTPTPSPEEIKQAAESGRQLAMILGKGNGAKIRVVNGDEEITLPLAALSMLRDILGLMAEGESIALVPQDTILTTQQAADFLNVSRPYFVKLLDDGKLTHRMVGTHRRVLFSDLVKYKEQSMIDRREAVEALTAETEELGLEF
jgi:excisionase family DNA binding protein